MASLPETDGSTYPEVRQIENGEPQMGGSDGLWNEHAKTMIERTNWLKERVNTLLSAGFQAGSAVLTALSGLATNGIIVRNGNGSIAARTISAGAGITVGNGDGVNGNPTIAANLAAEAEARAGTENTKPMTALRVAQAVSSLISGIASSAGFAVNPTTNGYIVFPSWLGGLVLQWGVAATSNTGAVTTVTFPLAFPTAVRRIVATANAADHAAANHAIVGINSSNWTATSFGATAIKHDGAFATTNLHYIALGH